MIAGDNATTARWTIAQASRRGHWRRTQRLIATAGRLEELPDIAELLRIMIESASMITVSRVSLARLPLKG